MFFLQFAPRHDLNIRNDLNVWNESRTQGSSCSNRSIRSSCLSPLGQLEQLNAFAKQSPLDDMALDFRRSFNDPSRPRVAESPRNAVLFAQRGRASNLQGKIKDLVDQLGAKELDVGRLRTDVHFLIGLPGTVVGQGSQCG